MINPLQKKAISTLLFHCGNLNIEDRALILCDSSTRPIAEAFVNVANEADHQIKLLEIPPLSNHGAEPPADAVDAMQASTLILSLCKYSLAHSKARINAAN